MKQFRSSLVKELDPTAFLWLYCAFYHKKVYYYIFNIFVLYNNITMSNSRFQFKKFTIYQDQCAMKVGTDGVLLGAWVNVKQATQLLDIGTGTGLIALMMAQRTDDVKIIAIELDQKSAIQAEKNVNNSPWSNKIEVIQSDILDYKNLKKFDVIVSNPPFFTNALKSPNKQRTIARHNNHLTYQKLIQKTAKLLSPTGRFSVILPYNQQKEFNAIALNSFLYPSKLLNVRTTPNGPFCRILSEYSFNKNKKVEYNTLLIEESRHQYSSQYIELTKDFYLNM